MVVERHDALDDGGTGAERPRATERVAQPVRGDPQGVASRRRPSRITAGVPGRPRTRPDADGIVSRTRWDCGRPDQRDPMPSPAGRARCTRRPSAGSAPSGALPSARPARRRAARATRRAAAHRGPVVGRVGLGRPRRPRSARRGRAPLRGRGRPPSRAALRSPPSLLVERDAQHAPRRPLAPGRDPHRVELLGVAALARARLAGDHAGEMEPEDLAAASPRWSSVSTPGVLGMRIRGGLRTRPRGWRSAPRRPPPSARRAPRASGATATASSVRSPAACALGLAPLSALGPGSPSIAGPASRPSAPVSGPAASGPSIPLQLPCSSRGVAADDLQRALQLRACPPASSSSISREHVGQRLELGLVALAQLQLELDEALRDCLRHEHLDVVDGDLDDRPVPRVQALLPDLAQLDEVVAAPARR